MNILLLCQYNPYIEIGASANRIRGLIEGVCGRGHHVIIGITGGLKKKSENAYKSTIPNIKLVYLSKANHYNGLLGRLNIYFFDGLYLSLAYVRLKRLMKQHFDIIWLTNNSIVLKLFIKGLKGFPGKTFIELNEYNDIYKEEKKGNYLQKIKGRKRDRLLLNAIGKIDLFAVMTKTLLYYYRNFAKPEAQFMHLPMTVDMSRFVNVTTTVDYKRPYIAFTGTMTNQKDGVDVLIMAFARIAEKYPGHHLYLAGFWHYDVQMQEKLILDLGLSDRIHYLGVLNREEIPPFICNAAVLALSRPDSHQAQGGFPTKLGEYLSTGNPVCVTKVGEIPDYLEDNNSAFMAKPGDVDSFANALDRALQCKEKAKQVGACGRIIAEEFFSTEVQANRLEAFLINNK